MPFKPMDEDILRKYLKAVEWKLVKGGIDYNLYDHDGNLVCSIKIAHGKNTKREIVAHSVHKIEKKFKERGLKWPPIKK